MKERVITLLKQHSIKEISEGDWWASSLEPIPDTAPLGFDLNVFVFDTLDEDSPYSIVAYPLYMGENGYLSSDCSEPIFTHSLPAKDFILWMDKDYEPFVYIGEEDAMLKEAIEIRFSEVTCRETVSEYIINQAVKDVLETADKDWNTSDVNLAVSRVIRNGLEALELSGNLPVAPHSKANEATEDKLYAVSFASDGIFESTIVGNAQSVSDQIHKAIDAETLKIANDSPDACVSFAPNVISSPCGSHQQSLFGKQVDEKDVLDATSIKL
jgi:hypothetical protein